MAGLTAQERLQPSLLDRLTDNDPSSSRESLDARVLSKNQLRSAVLRDLSWLFNTTCQEPPLRSRDVEGRKMWQEAPDARKSVLNYGMPPPRPVPKRRHKWPGSPHRKDFNRRCWTG